MQTKDFRLELKSVNEDGTFEGYLSVYNVVDLGNDLVKRGAFTKTIKENKGVVPLLWNHDTGQDMGLLRLSDDQHGLKVDGEMFVGESPLAKEKHAMAKRYHAAGRPVGLSIGYETVKKELVKGVRNLLEVKLYEGSMTLFPMLPVAQLTDIKRNKSSRKDDFLEELDEAQTYAMRYLMFNALCEALCDIAYDPGLGMAEKVAASDESIQQFQAAYTEFLPKLLMLMGDEPDEPGEMETASQKIGRTISAANVATLKDAIAKLQALLSAAESTSLEEAANAAVAAASAKLEPESVHSLLSVFDEFKIKAL